jgi:N-dimethylarginine dimethylaminohydrolase
VEVNEVGRLAHVVLKHPRDAFADAETIAAQWRDLNFTAPPDLDRAIAEYDRFVEAICSTGAAVSFLPRDATTTLDSIYVRDASIVSPRGMILCRMGKQQREQEPAAHRAAFAAMTPPIPVIGEIVAPGSIEGGDVIWLSDRTLVVGHGYRTNGAGIEQLRELLGDSVDEFVVVPLPHWTGESDVMHLMSLISPIDRDLAVAYSRLLPITLRKYLLRSGIELVDVPDEEFDSMATNVLAIAPRHCVMLSGNPRTRARLERAGASEIEYEGKEISVKGAGGPTCLTRPIARA